MCKQNKTRNSFTTSRGQAGAQPSPGRQGSITRNGALGRQTPSLQASPTSFFFSQLYILGMMPYGPEYPFGQTESTLLAVSPPNFLCPSSPLAGRARETQKSLTWRKHHLVTTKTISVLSTLFSHQTQNPALHQLLRRKLTLSQLKPGHLNF